MSKLTFLNFVYIMATGMILLARISYAMILHNKIPLCADSAPEHNFDPSAFSILTIQENCVHWVNINEVPSVPLSPIVLNKWKMIENSIYWHISTNVMFVFIFSTWYNDKQNCLLQKWNKLKSWALQKLGEYSINFKHIWTNLNPHINFSIGYFCWSREYQMIYSVQFRAPREKVVLPPPLCSLVLSPLYSTWSGHVIKPSGR